MLCGLYSKIESLRKLSTQLKEWKITLSPHQIGSIVRKENKEEEEEEEFDLNDHLN